MNNNLLKNVARKYSKGINNIKVLKNCIIYNDKDGNKYVVKAMKSNILPVYNYLNSRGFIYLPNIIYYNEYGYIYDFIDDIKMPEEQRVNDLIKLTSLLHNKTVYYKDISVDEIKEMYEKLNSKILDTFRYYDDVITSIETRQYYSPAEYMLARNSSLIFNSLNFCKFKLDEWYELMKENTKKRVVYLNNNLHVDHLIKNKDAFLISWDKSVSDLPIYDFIKLYKENYDKYDFSILYKEYIKRFPLQKEEKILLFILLYIPNKINFTQNELENTLNVSKLSNYLYITDKLFMENEAKDKEKQDQKINK